MSTTDGRSGVLAGDGATPGTAGGGIAHGVLAGLTAGFAAVVAMWILWFVLHLPAVGVSPMVAGPVLLVVQLLASVAVLRRTPAPSMAAGIGSGCLSGLTSGLVNLLVLGSKITQPLAAAGGGAAGEGVNPMAAVAPGAEGLVPGAGAIVAGFLALCVGLGAIAGALAQGTVAKPAREPEQVEERWLARLGLVSCFAVAPLLLLGGLVTSTHSGMAVPDWPGTYGANMFLYPIGLMALDSRVFLEHSHRLFGAMVGLTTLALAITAVAVTARRGLGRATALTAVGLFVLVCAQGWLGAERVKMNSPALAMVHGVVGQVFFALLVAWAVWVRPGFRAAVRGGGGELGGQVAMGGAVMPGRAAVPVFGWLWLGLMAQLVMGAMYRHLGSKHALWTHIGLSFVLMVLAIVAGSLLLKKFGRSARAERGDGSATSRGLGLLGVGLHAVVSLQFALGWVALVAVSSLDARSIPTAEQLAATEGVPAWIGLTRTMHQANGALLLALTTAGLVWTVGLTIAGRRAMGSGRET